MVRCLPFFNRFYFEQKGSEIKSNKSVFFIIWASHSFGQEGSKG